MNSYAESLSNKLKNTLLEKIDEALAELSAEITKDLKLLEEDANNELKLNHNQKQKLKELIKSFKDKYAHSKESTTSRFQHRANPGTKIMANNVNGKAPVHSPNHPTPSNMKSSSSNRQLTSKENDEVSVKAAVPCTNHPNNSRCPHNTISQASTRKGKVSPDSNSTPPKLPTPPINIIQKDCNIVSQTNGMVIYQPDMKIAYENKDVGTNFRKKVFGTPNAQPEKVILVVGATGSGKTTLINGIVNYLFAVNFKDPFRYKLILDAQDGSGNQSESQTKWITAYTLYYREEFPFPYTLTIIDTPGFGDTRGVKRDMEITKQIKNFFSTPGHQGIDHIDAIGFVAQACLSRLTPTQQYIFDSILSLFGKDVGENIFLLLTFADGKKPQVLAAIQDADIPCNLWFKFNNSVLFSEVDPTKTSDEDDDFDEMFWKMGTKSYKDFLLELSIVTPKSLTLTKFVLNTRARIDVTVQGLREEIQLGLTCLERLKDAENIVQKHKTEIEQNNNFTYTVSQDIIKHESIPNGTYITNCLTCNRTCHYPCTCNAPNISGCVAMKDGNCEVCPNKCHWSKHVNNDFKIVCVREEVTKNASELKERYQKARGNVFSAESIVSGIVDEIQARQIKIVGMKSEVRELLGKLDGIALKPNPLSTIDYIDILIDSEKSNARPGFSERIAQLQDIRKEVEFINSAIMRGEDPFEKYTAKIKEDRKAKNSGIWAQVGSYLDGINFFK